MRPTPGGWISADFDPWVENRGLIDWVVATTTDLHPAYRCVHPHIRGCHTRALPRFRGSPTQGDSCGSGDRHTRGDSCGSGDPTPGALTLPRFRDRQTQGDSCGSGDRHTRGDSCGSGDPTPGALTLPRFRDRQTQGDSCGSGDPTPGALTLPRFRGSPTQGDSCGSGIATSGGIPAVPGTAASGAVPQFWAAPHPAPGSRPPRQTSARSGPGRTIRVGSPGLARGSFGSLAPGIRSRTPGRSHLDCGRTSQRLRDSCVLPWSR